MSLRARFLWSVAAVVLVWAVLPVAAELTLFPKAWPRGSWPIWLVFLGLRALAFTAAVALARPVVTAVESEAEVIAAAHAGFRLPARVSLVVFVLALVEVSTFAVMEMERGLRSDLVASGAAVRTACGILAALLAAPAVAQGLAPGMEKLALSAEPVARATLRGKITWLSLALLAAALLAAWGGAYLRFGMAMEEEMGEAAGRGQERALALASGVASAELTARITGIPAFLLDAGGAVRAPPGTVLPTFSQAPSFRELPGSRLERAQVPGGSLVRHRGAALVSYLPDSVLEDRRASFGSRMAWLLLSICAAAVLLVVVSAHSITRPLGLLGSATQRIAAGDLTVRPPSTSSDELGLLAADFRRMTQRLKALLGDVQEANTGVGAGAREMSEIGDRVREGALAQHKGVVEVSGAVDAMQGSVNVIGNGIEGLSEYVGSTSAAVSEMAAALEEIRRQGSELERAMANTMEDVHGLGSAGQRAQLALRELESFASHAEGSLSDVNASLAGLETAAVASQLTAAQAVELADRAGSVVEETVQGIDSLRSAVSDAQRRVTSLGRRSDDIDHIVDFITEVAGRTNLLSLNASIIAARAGEHGKAFAVVADQIRELASQISSSTKSIGNIIRAVREDVEGTATLIHRGDELATAGVALARNSLDAIHKMTAATAQGHETAAAIREAVQSHAKSSGEVSNLVHLVATGSKAVSQAVDLVGRSVAGVGAVSRGVESLADQVSRALEEQSGTGHRQLESLERINAMISEVTLLVQNHNGATQSVRDALLHLSRTAELHEGAVQELAAVSQRLGGQAGALAERVAKFKV